MSIENDHINLGDDNGQTLLKRVKDVNRLVCTNNDKIDEEVLGAAGNIILLIFYLFYFIFLLEIA